MRHWLVVLFAFCVFSSTMANFQQQQPMKNTLSSSFPISANAYSNLLLTGGAQAQAQAHAQAHAQALQKKKKKMILVTSFTITIPALLYLVHQIYQNFSLTMFKDSLRAKLALVDSYGTPGLFLYAIVFSVWVAFGLTSTPIETAAGMAFGFKNACIASGVGKFAGAVLAFFFGRVYFRDRIEKQFKGESFKTRNTHKLQICC